MSQQQTALEVKKQASIETTEEKRFRDMCGKIKRMITNGRKLTDPEVYALAQFSAAERLDPFNQECWYIPGVGPSIGIKGLRKKGQEQLDKIEPGNYFKVDFFDVTTEYRDRDNNIGYAFRAVLKDTLTGSKYLSKKVEFLGKGIEEQEIIAVLGKPPEWEAIGFWGTGEADNRKDKFYHPEERAKKRAEALVIKKRFNLSYNYTSEMEMEEDAPVEFDLGEDSAAQIEEGIVEEEAVEGEISEPAIDNRYDADFRSPEDVKMTILGYVEDIKATGDAKPVSTGQKGVVVSTLQYITAPGDVDMKRHAIMKFVFGISSSKEMSDVQWRALAKYLDIEKISTGEYAPKNPIVNREINNLVAFVTSNEKQPELL